MGVPHSRSRTGEANTPAGRPAGANGTERALRALSAGNLALLRATDEPDMLREMCRVIVDLGGYRMAWVGYIEDDAHKTIRPMAHAGFETGFPEEWHLTWADEGIGRGPTGTAIRTARPTVLQNIREEIDPALAGVCEESFIRGSAAVGAFPLLLDGKILGSLTVMVGEPGVFEVSELAVLGELTENLALGVKILRGREQLRRGNRALRTLSAGNRTLLRATNEQQLLEEMCRVIVEEGGYRHAGVGYAEHDERKTVSLMAYAVQGADDRTQKDYFDNLKLTWADSDLGQHAGAIAFRTGEACIGRNLLTDPGHAPWREDAIRLGYRSLSAFPLRVEGAVIGALGIAAAEPDAFDKDEVRLLSELAEDLAYGIANLRNRIKRQEAETTIERMAYFDPVTCLPNRARLKELLAEAIVVAKQQHRPFALLTINVDHFREINDVIGYRQGDKLLQLLAARLHSALNGTGTLAHLGVDQFAVLLPRTDVEQAGEGAQQMLKALEEPFELAGIRVEVRASVGIALFPGHGADPDLLVLRADAAMYQAKRARSGFAVFRGDTEQENLRRLELIGDLRHAIEENQLVLYCQPKVDLRTGAVRSAEALVRWRHPERGLIEPDHFVPIAERTGLIRPLTYWVLNAALGQYYAWREAGLTLPLAVNLSARNLLDPKLLDRINGLLTTWGGEPNWLQIELTESALMEDRTAALEVLKRLHGMAIPLFVDDFGTGYSSLSYLQQLPIDAIKIDKSFVHDMIREEDSLVIVRSTIELAHNLGLEVVAEGVENHEIWNQLLGLGCDVAQGYYVSPPIPAEDFLDWQGRSPWKIELSGR